jgi:hypothetical protein
VSIGYDLQAFSSAAATAAPIPDPTASTANPLVLRLEAMWSEIEHSEGVYTWEQVDAIVDRFRASSHEVVLDLWGGNPLYGDDILASPVASNPKAVDVWTRFVRNAARHFKGRVRYFQIGKTPNSPVVWGGQDPVLSYSFLLKKSAVIVRAEAKGPRSSVARSPAPTRRGSIGCTSRGRRPTSTSSPLGPMAARTSPLSANRCRR